MKIEHTKICKHVFVSVTRAKRRPKLAENDEVTALAASVPKWEWPTQSLVHGRKL